MVRSRLLPLVAVGLAGALVSASPAAADLASPTDQWMPSPKNATWTWEWKDTYVTTPVHERYTVKKAEGASFQLAWTSRNVPGNTSSTHESTGTIDYQRTNAGLVNTDWSGTAPPADMPSLCSTAGQCGNSLGSAHFQLIWGTRSPVLLEPLVRGATWSSVGGANNDVASDSRYVGRRLIIVKAFPHGVMASGVQSQVSQAGALGDPYGSGVRTIWWVRGVGPVLVTFHHTGGEMTSAQLDATNLTPLAAPSDTNWFPLQQGSSSTFRWRNSKHLRSWSTQRFTVSQVTNGTAQIKAKSVRGPIKLAGAYLFTRRLNGVIALGGATSSATRAKFPALGPRSLPRSRHRHLITPYDFMTYGFNPVMPAYPGRGQAWSGDRTGSDWPVYGVSGHTHVLGLRTVRVPAGRFRALAITSTLLQRGYRYGSGTRTSYFAPGKGLVKLVFRHRDGSVSTVERVR